MHSSTPSPQDFAQRHRAVPVALLVVILALGALAAGGAAGAQPLRPAARSSRAAVTTTVLGMFLGNLSRTSDTADPSITTTTVHALKERWIIRAGASISAEPLVYNGVIYWADWGGYETASNATTGRRIWRVYLGVTVGQRAHHCTPNRAGVASSASLVLVNGALRLIVGTGAGGIASINASNGKIAWQRRIAPRVGGMIWSSPAVIDGSVYIGVASLGDCPLVVGKVDRLSAATGALQAQFAMSLPKGCSGDTVWSAPSIDPTLKALFITSANSNTTKGKYCYTKDADSIFKLSLTTLKAEAHWQVPRGQQFRGSDIGASPTLFNVRLKGHTVGLVGAADKNGIFYALRQSNLSLVWSLRFATSGNCPQCDGGTIASAAFDGTSLYLGSTKANVGKKQCRGTLRKVNPANGKVVWTLCLYDPVLAAPTAVAGVVFVTYGPQVNAIATATGKKLFSYFDPTKNALQWATVAVAGSWVYVPDMSGGLRAFELVKTAA